MGVLLFMPTGLLAVSMAIAKVEFLGSQTFGNIDLPIRYKVDASGVRQTDAIVGR